MGSKILTISVAAYNSEKYLNKCLDSLLVDSIINQIEIIVVNDGSKDNTERIAEEYVERYPDTVKLINKENGGHGSTINRSIPEAVGKYYKVVDADDWVERDGFVRLVKVLEKCESDMVLNPYYRVDLEMNTKVEESLVRLNSIKEGNSYPLSEFPENYHLAMHALTYKTDVLKKDRRSIDEHCFYVDREYVYFPIVNVNSFTYYPFFVYDYLFGTQEQSCNRQNMINRVDQHIKVCNSLISCYLSNDYSIDQKRLMLKGISTVVHIQYGLLYEIGNKEAREKYQILDRYIEKNGKDINKEIFKGITFKYKLKLMMLRLSNYRLFEWFCNRNK